GAELCGPEGQREPAGLVVEHAVVEQVGGEADAEHQPGGLEWPPLVQHGGERRRREERPDRGGEPRLEPASQRERHRLTLRRKPRAATFMPTSVSAAGNAHCAGAPARTRVRVPSVSCGTVESGPSTINDAT